MPKKAVSWLLLLSVFAALVLIVSTGEGKTSLSALYVDETKWNLITSTRTERVPDGGPEMQIADAVYFNGYKLPYDRLDQMLLYSLVENDPCAYDPQVELVCYEEDADIIFCGESLTDELIQGNRYIPMMVYTDDEYALFQLKCTTLPIMEIGIKDSPFTVKEESVTVRLRLFDNRQEAVNRQLDTSALIHMRGKNSKSYPKNDYRISLRTLSLGENWRDYHVPLLGLRADDDWILKGQYNDNRKIREVFSTDLWYHTCSTSHSFDVRNGNQYRYVEVFFGDYYWGMYALTHPIDAKQLKIEKGEHLYRKITTVSEFAMNFTIDPASAIDPDDQSDPRVSYSYEGIHIGNSDYVPLFDYYRTLLNSTEENRETLYNIADIDNCMDIFLFVNLIQGIDHQKELTNALYNMFLAAKVDHEGKTRILFTPWDMDRTWGMDFYDVERMDPAVNSILNTNLVVRLWELGDKSIVEQLCNRYWELRNNEWADDNLTRMICSYEKDVYLSGAYDRDFQRWYRFVLPPEYIPEYHGDYTGFIDYVHLRMQHMDEYIQQCTKSNCVVVE